MNNHHLVDILSPPNYTPSGDTQDIVTAIRSGAWLHVTNLWFYRTEPSLQILFQLRDLNSPVFPGLLDCSVAGYLEAGEDGVQGGIREAQEELNVTLMKAQIEPFGRHLNAGLDHRGRERKWVINEYIVNFPFELADVHPNEDEVPGIFWVSVDDLLRIEQGTVVEIQGKTATVTPIARKVGRDAFVPNIDDYHFRLAARLKQTKG